MSLRYYNVTDSYGNKRKEVDVLGSAGSFTINSINSAFDGAGQIAAASGAKSDKMIAAYATGAEELYEYLAEVQESGFDKISDELAQFISNTKNIYQKKPAWYITLFQISLMFVAAFGPFFFFEEFKKAIGYYVFAAPFFSLTVMLILMRISANRYKSRYESMKKNIYQINEIIDHYNTLTPSELQNAFENNKSTRVIEFESDIEQLEISTNSSKVSKLAVTSLISGALSFTTPSILFSLIAIGTGSMAISWMANGIPHGKKIALAGLILGCVNLFGSYAPTFEEISIKLGYSAPEKAREAAIASCKAIRDKDYDKLKEVIGEKSFLKIEHLYNIEKFHENSERYKQMQVDCNSVNVIGSYDNGTRVLFTYDNNTDKSCPCASVEKIDGVWRTQL